VSDLILKNVIFVNVDMETRVENTFIVRSLHVAYHLYMVIAVITFIKTLALVWKKKSVIARLWSLSP